MIKPSSRLLATGLVLALVATVVLSGCSERSTDSRSGGSPVALSLNLTSSEMAHLVSEFRVIVTGPNIVDSIVRPLVWSGPYVEGDITVPSGRSRRFVVEAMDSVGTVIYRGQQVADLPPGAVVPLIVNLYPVVSLVRTLPRELTVASDIVFALPVRVYNIDSLYGVSMRIMWDNAVVQADSAHLSLAIAGMGDVILFDRLNADSNYYAVSVTPTDQTTPIVNGEGDADLVTVFFSTVAPTDNNGSARITLDVTGLSKPSGDSIPTGTVVEEGTSLLVLGNITNAIQFADPNLEAAVRAQMEVPTGDITPAQAAQVTTLSLVSLDISDLTGLAYFTGLQALYLANNRVVNITHLTGLINLTILDLTNNDVVDLTPLTLLINLQTLGLAGNQISDITPLVGNAGLGSGDEVFLYENPLNSISTVTYIPALRARGVTVEY